MTETKYSAVIIAKNDESTIGECILAMQKLTNDILIVLDDRSDDNTENICLQHGARLIKKPWEGYSKNKNFGADHAKNDWILCPDADEVFDDILIQKLKEINPKDDQVYEMNRLTYFMKTAVKHSGWFPDWNIRLYNKKSMRWNDSLVHESLESTYPLRRQRLSGIVRHYSFRDENHMKEKYDIYAKLRANEWIKANKKPSIFKMWFGPYFRFVRTFILKLGFLDGKTGYTIAKNDFILKRKEIYYWRQFPKSGTNVQ
jgi:glycosyltransferase involved in cell wall biosynthesis